MQYPALLELRPWLLSTALLGALGCNDNARRAADAPADAEDLDIELLDLDGRAVDLRKSHPGRVVVAIFTRSDCPVSNRYAPEVRALYERFEPQGVAFYLIFVDPREQPDAIRAHLAEYDYTCPALRDPQHSLVAATGAKVTPEAVVFDNERNVTYRGRIDDLYADLGQARPSPTRHDLADAIEATLAGRSVVEPVTTAVGCKIEDLK